MTSSAGQAAGQFSVADAEIALSAVAGGLIGLLRLHERHPERVAESSVDELAEACLRLLGLRARSPTPRPAAAAPGGQLLAGAIDPSCPATDRKDRRCVFFPVPTRRRLSSATVKSWPELRSLRGAPA